MAVRHNHRLMRLQRALHAQHAARKANPFRELWWNLRKVYFYRWLERRWGGFIDLRSAIGLDPSFLHGPFGVFIGNGVIIGDRVVIGQHVTIGISINSRNERKHSPRIGNDVFIGANATIIGRCSIGNGAKIGAGVVLVDADVPAGSTIVDVGAYDLTRGDWVHHRNPFASERGLQSHSTGADPRG